MRGIQFKKNGICFRAILLVLICIPLLSFFSNIGNGLTMQDSQTAGINQDSVSACYAGKDIWRSIAHQNPLVGVIFVQYTDFPQDTQRLLSYKNNSCMTIFCGSSYSSLFRTTPGFISQSGQIPVCKIKYFLIAPHKPNAPPYILT